MATPSTTVTAAGKGRALKERHGTLLDDNIQVDDVYVLCSSVPRTIESVQCLLKGFFEQQKTPQVYVHRYAHNVLATTHPLQDDVVHLRSKVERADSTSDPRWAFDTWSWTLVNPSTRGLASSATSAEFDHVIVGRGLRWLRARQPTEY
uniref:Uncharacterized protein n=1 Tax=Phytophthora ramorum TaxID=164328 RepID=H3H2H1_PHYRM